MTTSLAAVFEGTPRRLELQRFEVPSPAGSEVLVRVLGCTLCGSDLHSYEGRRSTPTPTILGHEIVGRIEAFGPTAARSDAAGGPLALGDRVTWSIVASCGKCFYCRRDLPQKCQRAVKYGHEPLRPGLELRGGLAEHCLLHPGTAIVRLPDELPLEVACPASCATATIAAALEAAGPVAGRTVCVLGAGMLGLTACAMAQFLGASEVICVDVQPQRLERAVAFGATQAVQPDDLVAAVTTATGGHGVDVVLELSGSADAFEGAFGQLRLGGTMVLVGAVFPVRPVPLLMEQMVRRQATLRGVHNYGPRHLQAAVRFLADQRVGRFETLVTDWLPLAESAKAFELATGPRVIRFGVRCFD